MGRKEGHLLGFLLPPVPASDLESDIGHNESGQQVSAGIDSSWSFPGQEPGDIYKIRSKAKSFPNFATGTDDVLYSSYMC